MAFINQKMLALKDLNLSKAFTDEKIIVDKETAIIEGMFLWELCKCGVSILDITEEHNKGYNKKFGLLSINYGTCAKIEPHVLSNIVSDDKLLNKNNFSKENRDKLVNVLMYLATARINKEFVEHELKQLFNN